MKTKHKSDKPKHPVGLNMWSHSKNTS